MPTCPTCQKPLSALSMIATAEWRYDLTTEGPTGQDYEYMTNGLSHSPGRTEARCPHCEAVILEATDNEDARAFLRGEYEDCYQVLPKIHGTDD